MEHAMYIIINNDLNMGKGKIAAQACHAACRVTRCLHGQNNADYNTWLRSGEAKIVLKGTEKQMLELIEKYDNSKTSQSNRCVNVHDAGHTQVAPNSLTAIAFFPVLKKNAPEELSKYKLL
jgi:PTH2 family peptidyl-tRNA hydrolase